MKIRNVAIAGAAITSAVLAISAQSASAGVPTIGRVAAAAPRGTHFSVCELALKLPVCEGIPASVVSAMSGLPADSAGAVQVAKSLGLAASSAAFAYCHGGHVTGTSNIGKDCIFVSILV